MSQDQADLDAVVESLDLEELDRNLYRGFAPYWEGRRLFGGLVAAQALAAAYRTIEDIHVHSLHSYFLRPGDPTMPVIFDVDRIRDGRSFATRRVVARQRGEAIFNLSSSFHKVEAGFDHQQPKPAVPGPDGVPAAEDFGLTPRDYLPRHWETKGVPIEIRHFVSPDGVNEATGNHVFELAAQRIGGQLRNGLQECVREATADRRRELSDTLRDPEAILVLFA